MALDNALAECHFDITERPKVKKTRSVTVKLSLRPSDSGEDMVDAVDIEFEVSKAIPKTVIRRQMASLPRQKALGFETDTNKVTHAPNQRKLVDADDDE